jgi:predicted nucleic acid-binding protein
VNNHNIEVLKGLLLDANVIIDLRNVNEMNLTHSLSESIDIYVVEETREKILGLTRSYCEELGLLILEPTLEEILDAASFKDEVPQLADDDALTLAVGMRRSLAIISNDSRVRKFSDSRKCRNHGGFFLLLFLFKKNLLTENECLQIADKIIQSNKWMSHLLFDEFKKSLTEALDNS